eukprot:6965556-Alexandrium_andersonii.AAC.1
MLRPKLPCQSSLANGTTPVGRQSRERSTRHLCGGKLASLWDVSTIGRRPMLRASALAKCFKRSELELRGPRNDLKIGPRGFQRSALSALLFP